MSSIVQFEAEIEVYDRKKNELDNILVQMKEKELQLCEAMYREQGDVVALESESFKSILFKMLSLYEGKLTKEQDEYLRAKLHVENHQVEMKAVENKRRELVLKIEQIHGEYRLHREKLDRQAFEFLNQPANEASGRIKKYHDFKENERRLSSECLELKEASDACQTALASVKKLRRELLGADGLGAADVMTTGGPDFINSIRREKKELVRDSFRQVESDLNQLNRELLDVGSITPIEPSTDSSSIWYDNIYAEMKVNQQVQEKRDQLLEIASTLTERLKVSQLALRSQQDQCGNLLLESRVSTS